jgi:hypothetical protein
MSNLYDTLDTSVLKKPGQYYLTDVVLVSYRSAKGDNVPDKIGIETMVADLNIFESIYNKTLSGNLFIVDTQNIVGRLPLTGNERLEFKLYTPSSPFGYDFSEKTGNPMYIYKIQNRTGTGPRSQAYIIHFCSKEMITNELQVVSNAQTATYSDMAANITKNPDFLGSGKNFFYEPSIGLHKHVFTRQRPFDAIDDLSQLTISKKFDNAGYNFYETSRGFNYRSLESMLAVEANTARPVAARFRPKPANISDGQGEKDIKNEMQVVMDYAILDQFDTLKNLRNGVYASKLITHDQLNKTYKEYDFSYEDQYGKNFHTESNRDGTRDNQRFILPKYLKEGATLSEYPDSTLYLWPTTSQLHNGVERPPVDQIVQKRLSQRLAFQSFKLQITVNGFTGLQAGDLITFEMPSYEPNTGNEMTDNDAYMSGRYLITSVRHQINRSMKKHIMVLECMKDSVRLPYPEEINDTFIGREKNNEGIIDIYEFDDIILQGLSSYFR